VSKIPTSLPRLSNQVRQAARLDEALGKNSLLKFQDKNGVVIQYYNDKTKDAAVLRKGGRCWLEGNELDVNADIIVLANPKEMPCCQTG
jgi:hypothetical protein